MKSTPVTTDGLTVSTERKKGGAGGVQGDEAPSLHNHRPRRLGIGSDKVFTRALANSPFSQ